MVEELRTMVGTDETVLYEGKPNLSCFIFESIFNPLLPVAIVWALFDFNFLKNAMGDMGYVLLPFMLLHLMPVWIYLAGAVFSLKKYRNTYYIVTRSPGVCVRRHFTMNLETKTFS